MPHWKFITPRKNIHAARTTQIERRELSVQQLVHRALSRSSTAPGRIGDAVPRLAAEIEALLEPWASDGTLTEVIATYALIARRPDGSA